MQNVLGYLTIGTQRSTLREVESQNQLVKAIHAIGGDLSVDLQGSRIATSTRTSTSTPSNKLAADISRWLRIATGYSSPTRFVGR
jgi:hypothetical protein